MCNLLKISQVKLLILILTLISLSCNNEEIMSHDIRKVLIGTWELDSVSNYSGRFIHTDESKFLTFFNNTNYSYEWHNGDVGNKSLGKYFILDNPKRGLKTITLIPDIQISGKDTIRIECLNFDIVHADSQKLQVVEQTKFIKRDSLPYIVYNRNNIYKHVK